jgi:4-hydroxythreonine-4-phosphate dehydrogenase
MGDANGVGPEIILKAYTYGELTGDFIVAGDYSAMRFANEQLESGVPLRSLGAVAEYVPDALCILDAGMLTREQITPGKLSKEVAAASRQYVVTAAEMARKGIFGAIVTLPVNKEAIRLTDPGFTGHTELIAGLCGQDNYTMMLASKKLTVTHVSTHVSMAGAIASVIRPRVLDVIRLTNDALGRFIERPRIAVAGLNAHAGEGGAFGRQEIDEIEPAVNDAIAQGIAAAGPLPPDTVFWRAVRGEFDAVVCMYHDQGHIPMKLLDFEGGVNVTLGLDIIRTSVDHGTAFDIAWQGKAATGSFVAAFEYAKLIT